MKKKKLKRRMLIYVSIALILAMVISSIVSYIYFANVVREQKISDETARIQQLSNQINFMAEDIENFGRSIIVDEMLQEYLSSEVFATKYMDVRNRDNIRLRLVFYNSLRPFVGGSYLMMKDGTKFHSSTSTDEDYMNRKLDTHAIMRYNINKDAIFSEPYMSLEAGMSEPLVCYRIEMWDKNNYGTQTGTLYLEIFLEYFLKQIKEYENENDRIILTGYDQQVLYVRDKDDKVLDYLTGPEFDSSQGVVNIKGGYLITEEIGNTGWQVSTLVSDDSLWERGRFVLEFFAISFVISIVFILLITSKVMENAIQPITTLSEEMQNVNYDQLEMSSKVHTNDEIQTLYECYEKMLIEIQDGKEKSESYEKRKREMEFDIMLSQINPHYLYNVLNTVVYLTAAEKNEDVMAVVKSLLYTLQETLNLGDGDVNTTIKKELELTTNYVKIQQYRYPNIFQVKVDCREELMDLSIPKTIIQPLVENSIIHGILPTERSGGIEIVIKEVEGALRIQVEDDGTGISDEQIKRFEGGESIQYKYNERKHIGISNVFDRIKYLYGEPYGMVIARSARTGGTVITICLPLIKEMDR